MEKLREGPSSRCWNKFKEESLFAQYSPFLLSLAAGDLPPEDFLHFMSQDLHFLRAFAGALKSARSRTNCDAERWALSHLRNCLLEKIKTYGYLAHDRCFSSTRVKQRKNDATTVEYKIFLHNIASSEVEAKEGPCRRKVGPAYTLAAIAPCMRLCSHLCHQIQNILDRADTTNIYKNWIEYCSSQAFEDSVLEIEDKLDKFSDSFSGKQLEEIEKIYHQAMEFRVEFFVKIPIDNPTYYPLSRLQDLRKHRLIIFCDYNMTCAMKDSAFMLAQARIDRSYEFAKWQETWDGLSTKRAEELEKCLKCIGYGLIGEKVTTGGEFNYKGLRAALEQVAYCEKRANIRVVRSGLLQDLSLEDIRDTAMKTELQSGCKSFFKKIVRNGSSNTDLHIISCSWSSDLIRSVLSDLYPAANVFNVHSNELAYNGVFVTTGDIKRKVESAADKLEYFHKVEFSKIAEMEQMTVCIGGHVVDLLCLLEANIGIVISPSQSLRNLANRFGVKFFPLFNDSVKRQRELGYFHNWQPRSGILYTACCWAEIEAFLLGL